MAVNLSERDIKAIETVVATEVGSNWAGDTLDQGVAAIVDTILNRVDHPDYPDTVDGVVNEWKQFSAINSPLSYAPGTWDKVPESTGNKKGGSVRSAVQKAITSRAEGNPSVVAGHVNYANPLPSWKGTTLSGNNARPGGWVHAMNADPALRVGQHPYQHIHGTAPGATPLDEAPEIGFVPSPENEKPGIDDRLVFNAPEGVDRIAPPVPTTKDGVRTPNSTRDALLEAMQPLQVSRNPFDTERAPFVPLMASVDGLPAVPRTPVNRGSDLPVMAVRQDNSVGPLSERDTGQPLPRTVQEMWSGAPKGTFMSGGPIERALSQGSRDPAPISADSDNVQSMPTPASDFSAVAPSYKPGLSLSPSSIPAPRTAPRAPAAPTPSPHPETMVSLSNPGVNVADAYGQYARSRSNPGNPLPKPGGMSFAGNIPAPAPRPYAAQAPIPQARPQRMAQVATPPVPMMKPKAPEKPKVSAMNVVRGALMGGAVGGVPGAVVGGVGSYLGQRALNGTLGMPSLPRIGSIGGIATQQGFQASPYGAAVTAASQPGATDADFHRTLNSHGGGGGNPSLRGAYEAQARRNRGERAI